MKEPGNKKRFTGHDISACIEQKIIENGLVPGVLLPTAAEIAKQYDVSSKTADRAIARLANKGLVTRKRGAGTFVKTNRLSTQKLRVALFLWRHPFTLLELDYAAYDYFNEILESELESKGYNVEVFLDNPYDKAHAAILTTPLMKYDVIITVAGILETAEHLLRSAKAQIILMNDDIVHPGPWHQVVYDYIPGFIKALKYYRDLGFSKFFIASAPDDTSARRVNAILLAADHLHIPRENLIIHIGKSDIIHFAIISGIDCANYYLKNNLSGLPILSVSDFLAFGILDVFMKNSMTPGKDFKIISYDNMESRIDPKKLQLGLSGITHPLKTSANAVVTMLENITRKQEEMQFYQTYFVQSQELVLRKTT